MVLGGAGDGLRMGFLQTGLPRPVLISIRTKRTITSKFKRNYHNYYLCNYICVSPIRTKRTKNESL